MLSRVTRTTLLANAIAATLAMSAGASNAAPTSGSPYFTDVQSTHVEDATSKGIGTVNMIVCIMNSMAPDKLVNKGDYIALVDENKCDPNSRSDASQSGSSSGGQTTYTTTVVNS